MSEIILWRRIDFPGHEVATLDLVDGRWQLSGTAVFLSERGPCKLEYAVFCTSAWRTESAQVTGVIGGHRLNLVVAVNSERRWYLNGSECCAVEGCMDIDLGFSPSTNLLPIRPCVGCRRAGRGSGSLAAVSIAGVRTASAGLSAAKSTISESAAHGSPMVDQWTAVRPVSPRKGTHSGLRFMSMRNFMRPAAALRFLRRATRRTPTPDGCPPLPDTDKQSESR